MPQLQWKSFTGEVFSVHTTTNLVASPFAEYTNGLSARPPTNTWVDPVPLVNSLFYRLEL